MNMVKKLLIPIYSDEVAPRFDLAAEVYVLIKVGDDEIEEEKIVVLPQASAEKLCHLILTENIQTVICGAIEDEYYQFLKWKKVTVIDSVSGSWVAALKLYNAGSLNPGEILCQRSVEGKRVNV